MGDRIFGASALLDAPGIRRQLVRVSDAEPATWALDLFASGPVRFEIVAGATQGSRAFSVDVDGGRQTVSVVATDVQVSALHVGPAGVIQCEAFAAPGSPLDRSPDTVRAQVVAGPLLLPASGRRFLLLYNPDAVVFRTYDFGGGVVMGRVAPLSTVTLEWAGAVNLPDLGTYHVAEMFR